ncbi:CHAT domain-containing protein [Halarchaeum acidiphilum]|nr:CHAT domain-containing protein [Halarchaeum acidiphilum]
MRHHPPALAFDPASDATDSTASAPETGVELVLPPEFETLFVAAPLAYYLSASVRTVEDATPTLRASAVGVRRELADPARDAPALLERTFWLDCLVRLAAAGRPTAETDLLDRLEIDADATVERPIAERLRTYLDVPYADVRGDLPEWPLAMYVEPTVENARALPAVLHRLGHVYPPESTALDGRELLRRSLDAFYREEPATSTAAVDVVKPRLRRGRVHGWLADGTPIDAFKTRSRAYGSDRATATDGDPLSVAVILNDAAMASEHARVAEIYRERAADVPMDVTLREDLTRAQLAAVFAREHDFVHYIGHCESDGLRCADGALAAADVETSNARTFFLNACGSYHEGLELVERGSVAGAVTFRKVLDEQAARVGTAFARLLVAGFEIERALRLARRRIAMGKEYAVVGDGTHVVAGSSDASPATLAVEPVGDDRVQVTYDAHSVWWHGTAYRLPASADAERHLRGNETTLTLSRADARSLLDAADAPTIYDGELRWSDDVRDAL